MTDDTKAEAPAEIIMGYASDVRFGPAGDPLGLTPGYDRRPFALGELPLAPLPAEVEAHLSAVEQRLADKLAEDLGVPVTAGAPRPTLPIADAQTCGPATCAGRGEPLFTLAEALQEVAERTCAAEGHDLDVISTNLLSEPTPRPVAIVCRRPCQFRGYRVVAIGEPDVAELLTSALVDLWADLGAAYDRSPADPRDSSIECVGLITRIVDVTRTLGVTPAELVPPALVASGLYAEVHRLAGHAAAVAPCTMESALLALAARGGRPPAPCDQWARARTHAPHDWDAPTDGPVRCPGWHGAAEGTAGDARP